MQMSKEAREAESKKAQAEAAKKLAAQEAKEDAEELTESRNLKEKSINLEKETSEVIDEIKKTKDAMLLMQTRTKENNKGKRKLIINAINEQLESMNPASNLGKGSDERGEFREEDEDDIYTPINPMVMDEIEQGKGSEAAPQTKRERLEKAHKLKQAQRRTNNMDRLSAHTVRADGLMIFEWGHIYPHVEELRDLKDPEKITRGFKEALVVLKECPDCTKANKPDSAANGECYTCDFDMVEKVRQMIAAGKLSAEKIKLVERFN